MKPNLNSAALAGALAMLLSGCLSSGGPQTRRADFVCDNGERITVVFQPNMARIVSTNPAIEMPRRNTPRGFWFGTDQNQIRGEGASMQWTRGMAAPINCRELAS